MKKRKMLWGEKKVAETLDKVRLNYAFFEPNAELYAETMVDMRFDFTIYHKNKIYVIEYDQPHHFRPDKTGDRTIDRVKQAQYEKQQKYDAIKNSYCRDNSIPILRIPHYEWENVSKLIIQFLIQNKILRSVSKNKSV